MSIDFSFTPNTTWPPTNWSTIYTKYDEWSAWYSGDAQTICDFYTGELAKFWGKAIPSGERRVAVHVPIAGDIAATSANLLFGERPKIAIPEAAQEGATAEALAAQARLDQILADGGFFARLQEAAEAASAMSGVILKVDWDKKIANYPILSVVHVDAAYPEFSYGILTACTLWRVIDVSDSDGTTVWRHLERHELDNVGNGLIRNSLYRGTNSVLGTEMDLAAHPLTAKLQPVQRTQIPGLLCRYIPNMRPNRLWRWTYLGQSDYSGSEGIFDSLDETMSNWQRDVRLGKGRIIAPERYFQKDSDLGKMTFDPDTEVYVKLNVPPSPNGPGEEMSISQFAIRANEHEQTELRLAFHAISNAGYSPQTFGFEVKGQAESGTALDIRRDKSYKTTAKKAEYWRDPLADLCEIMLIVDRLYLGGKATPMRPTVEMQDGTTPSISQMAETVELIARAKAASTETLVKLLHPDWSEEQVDEEVQRITDESQVTLPDLAGLGLDEGGNSGASDTGNSEGNQEGESG